MNRAIIAIMVAFVGVGCGGDDDDDRATVGDLCNAQDGVLLELINKQIECNEDLYELLFNGADISITEAQCRAAFEPFLDDGTAQLATIADIDACRAAIAAESCDTYNIDDIDACDDIGVGTIAVGGDCESDIQCEGDAYCDESGSGCGVCVTRKPDSASCTDNNECASRYCDDDDDTCSTKNVAGGACNEQDDCRGRLTCNLTTSECQRIEEWAAGDTCDGMQDFQDCAPLYTGLWCNPQTNECTAFLSRGADCSGGGLCDVFAGDFCDAQGTDLCTAPTTVGAGEDCTPGTGVRCGSELICRDDVCTAVAQEGDSCDEAEGEDACFGAVLLECVNGTCQVGEYEGVCPAPA